MPTPTTYKIDFVSRADAAEHLAALGYTRQRAPAGSVERYSAMLSGDDGGEVISLASICRNGDDGSVTYSFSDYPVSRRAVG